jgi:S-adenosylmethionine hydrolase
MAPIGAHISNGIPIKNFGPAIDFDDLLESPLPCKIFSEEKKIQCIIQFVDSFGTGTTNLSLLNNRIENSDIVLKEGSMIKIYTKENDFEGVFTTHFSNVDVNSILFLAGSTGFLEISINQGNASEELCFKVGDIITITF